MSVVYLDSGLTDLYADYRTQACKSLCSAFSRQGSPAQVVLSRMTSDQVATEFDAISYVRSGARDALVWEQPLTEALKEAYSGVVAMVGEDFATIDRFLRPTLIYVASAPVQLVHGGALWLAQCDAADRPAVVFDLGSPIGGRVGGTATKGPVTIDPPQKSATGALFRAAGELIAKIPGLPLGLVSTDLSMAHVASGVLGLPVINAGMPQAVVTGRRLRSLGADGRLVVGFMGQQRLEKGYRLLPELAEMLLSQYPALHMIVQHSRPEDEQETTATLQELAAFTDQLEVLTGVQDDAAYAALLDRIDMLVLPYQPEFYTNRISGLAADAIANGVVTVVPQRTMMSMLLEEVGGGGGGMFADWNASSIATAVSQCIDRFNDLARAAHAAAMDWDRLNGPDRHVRQVLEIAAQLGGRAPDPEETWA